MDLICGECAKFCEKNAFLHSALCSKKFLWEEVFAKFKISNTRVKIREFCGLVTLRIGISKNWNDQFSEISSAKIPPLNVRFSLLMCVFIIKFVLLNGLHLLGKYHMPGKDLVLVLMGTEQWSFYKRGTMQSEPFFAILHFILWNFFSSESGLSELIVLKESRWM